MVVMGTNMPGISRELIIHPGETIRIQVGMKINFFSAENALFPISGILNMRIMEILQAG